MTQERVTRAGTRFNPTGFLVEPIDAPPDVSLSRLLKAALLHDGDGAEDPEQDVDANPPPQWPNEVKLVFPLPPRLVMEPAVAAKKASLKRRLDVGLEEGEIDIHGLVRKKRRGERQRVDRDGAVERRGQVPTAAAIQQHVGGSRPVEAGVDLMSLPSTSCGYRARAPETPVKKEVSNFEDLKSQGFRVHKATCVPIQPTRAPMLTLRASNASSPVVDPNTGKVFGIFCPGIDDPTYRASCEEVFKLLEECREEEVFSPGEDDHIRGRFVAVNYGVGRGQGLREPHKLSCKHEAMMQRIIGHPSVVRMATFASCESSSPTAMRCAKTRRRPVLHVGARRVFILSRETGCSVHPPKIWSPQAKLCS